MKKPAIPQVPRVSQTRDKFDEAVKENLEQITGRRGGLIAKLDSAATLGQVVAKINEILDKMQ